jgi:hypothetical protein
MVTGYINSFNIQNFYIPPTLYLCAVFILLPPPPNGSTAPWGPRPPHFSRLHDHTFLHTPHSVGLLWTRDQLVAETSTWQHTTLRRDRHPCPRRDSNGRRPTPYTARPLGSAALYLYYNKHRLFPYITKIDLWQGLVPHAGSNVSKENTASIFKVVVNKLIYFYPKINSRERV